MSKIEKVVKEISDLRDFYLKIKNRKANKSLHPPWRAPRSHRR